MTEKKIQVARDEAQRFMFIAYQALERFKKDKMIGLGSKETSACRRASMDLTRALSEMRKP